jgi:hypothetical protein
MSNLVMVREEYFGTHVDSGYMRNKLFIDLVDYRFSRLYSGIR